MTRGEKLFLTTKSTKLFNTSVFFKFPTYRYEVHSIFSKIFDFLLKCPHLMNYHFRLSKVN
ncbi:hypothetical protein SAMN05421639_1011042 [Chryseobacterium shigense]|uniref:Uncharacterized protein n=1 Tax=Chryseobacterium shigense TaxID=297244 RepID=A0A1N7I1A7_9FLAO|nr:hypothetical protein SAMN05421639_1011042 [Chryseobacterium shigense]